MGDILPFIQKVRSNGDWTAAERARLEELAERFTAAGVKVEVVYGVTEDGDPWCVVKDADEEVLVHVARIGGAFVVHYALDDALNRDQDLPSALGERLSWAEADDRVIVPFGRQAQTLLALVIATAFFYDTAAVTAPETSHPAALPEPDVLPVAALAEPLPTVDKRELAQHASMLGTTTDPATTTVATSHLTPEAPSLQAFAVRAAAADPIPLQVPTPTNTPAAPAIQIAETQIQPSLRLTGSAGADHLVGTAGDDTLSGGGAPRGGHDLLEGGAGDDKIFLGAQVVAIGGEGADSFVVVAPAQPDLADTLLGVVLDFHAAEGDRLITTNGRVIALKPATPEPLVTVSVDGGEGVAQTFVTGRRVDVDTDGDGRPDGYVVVAETGHVDAAGVTSVGQALPPTEVFG